MKSFLRNLDGNSNLLFCFNHRDKPQTSKKNPWLGKIYDFDLLRDDDSDSEDPHPFGTFATMVTDNDIVSEIEIENELRARKNRKHMESRDVLAVAPSESLAPRNIFLEPFAEERTYVKLFGGRIRSVPKKRVTYHERCKYEIRHKDRRFAQCVENLFFKCMKSRIKTITDSQRISMRKVCDKNGSNYTVKQVKKDDIVYYKNQDKKAWLVQ